MTSRYVVHSDTIFKKNLPCHPFQTTNVLEKSLKFIHKYTPEMCFHLVYKNTYFPTNKFQFTSK